MFIGLYDSLELGFSIPSGNLVPTFSALALRMRRDRQRAQVFIHPFTFGRQGPNGLQYGRVLATKKHFPRESRRNS